jgi:nicotinate dehydrogenase subunit A
VTINLNVNDKDVQLDIEADTPLLYALRNDLELNGPKFGCGAAQCGTCTVLVDGNPIRSCVMPVAAAVGRKIVTLEGLGKPEEPHPLQAAFIKEQAMQCGYCANSMIMTAAALLEKNKNPTEEQIRSALSGNLCRCGAHGRIVRAVSEAARSYQEGEAS